MLRLGLLAALFLSLAVAASAAADSLYIKWRSPQLVENVSIVLEAPGRSDDSHGPYLAAGVRFRQWAYLPLLRVVKFLDTRIRDPSFPEGYRGLWLLQGAAWRHVSGKRGYCYWVVAQFSEDGVNASFTRIGVSAGYVAAYAVLDYGTGPRPLDAPIGSLSVIDDRGVGHTLVNVVGGRVGRVTLLLCGPPGYRFHFKVLEGRYWQGFTSARDVFLALPGEPEVLYPSAPLPDHSSRALLLGAGALTVTVLAVMVLARR